MAPLVSTLNRDRAFERLYRRYAGDVYRYALAVLRNPADAEDATQTTFMNAYRAMQRGEEPRKPQNWLITIAHNSCRKRFATASRRVREVPLDESLATLPVADDERPSVEGVLEALGQLPFNQRSALVMRELEGRSYNEIAETLGVSRSAVEALLFRARRSLNARRATLRSLGAVQLPGSLVRFFDEPSTLVGGGTAAAGTGIAAKVALVLTVGAVATGGAVADTQSHSHRSPRLGTGITNVSSLSLARPAARVYSLPPLARDRAAVAAAHAAAFPGAGADADATGSSTSNRTGEQIAAGEAASAGSHAAAGAAAETPSAEGDASSSDSQAPAHVARPVTTTVAAVAPVRVPSTPPAPVAVPQLPATPTAPVSPPQVTPPTLP